MPDSKLVVIVARTRMYGGRVCIGAMGISGESLRLMNPNCSSDRTENSPYQVGEKWEIICAPCGNRKTPHVEDVAVTKAARLGMVNNLVQFILERATPWTGNIDVLFDGMIQFTGSGAGYIAEPNVPAHATGFWIPSSALILGLDHRSKQGYYSNSHHHLNYVGVPTPVERIDAGQLVRVSLAGWWKPRDADASLEERCYAQLSGWY